MSETKQHLRDTAAALQAEVDRLTTKLRVQNAVVRSLLEEKDPGEGVRAVLRDAIDLAEEGWAYASPYFREKWSAEERIEVLRDLAGSPVQSAESQEKT